MNADDDATFDDAIDKIQQAVEKQDRDHYSKRVLEEANNPQNVGRMQKADAAAEITGPCGDTMEFYLKIEDGKISDINFWTDGCGATIACGSIATKLVKGKEVAEAIKVTNQDIIKALDGLPEENLHCAKLAADTLHKAIRNYLDSEAVID